MKKEGGMGGGTVTEVREADASAWLILKRWAKIKTSKKKALTDQPAS